MNGLDVPRLLESVTLQVSVPLHGDLVVPDGATSMVIFAHGSASSRLSVRNQSLAVQLQRAGFATLLLDLLTRTEDASYQLRFDIPTLGYRIVETIEWASAHAVTSGLRIGLFGASTGAAASLVAAAARPDAVRAVVSRGGRPDLAASILPRVIAPTRLIVGELDRDVIGMNRHALGRLGSSMRDLVIVPRASHLFEEAGTLARVGTLAVDWFGRFMASGPRAAVEEEG